MKCPICGEQNNSLMQVRDPGRNIVGDYSPISIFGVGTYECKTCDYGYNDYISSEVLSFFYKGLTRRTETDEEITRIRSDARLNGESQIKSMKSFLPEKIGRVLDFGGSFGEAARLYLPFSEKVYVLEENDFCHAFIKEQPDLKIVSNTEIEDDRFIDFFDLIVFSNVLEHMPLPFQQLDKFSRIIKKDSFLFIEVPCEKEMFKQAAARGAMHVGLYTQETLEKLIEYQGSFDIVDIKRCGASTRAMIEKGSHLVDFNSQWTEDGYEIRALLRNSRPKIEVSDIEYDANEQDRIISNLSQYLFQIAQKRL